MRSGSEKVSTKTEYIEVLIGGGSGGEIFSAMHEKRVRKDLLTLLGQCWSRLHHCGHFRSLRRVVVIVEGSVDEDRIGGSERQCAMLYQICGILEHAAKDRGPGFALGRTVRPRRLTRRLFVACRSLSCRRLTQGSGRAGDGEATPTGEGTPQAKSAKLSDDDHDDDLRKQTRAAVKHAVQTEQQGRCKLRAGCDLHDGGPALFRDRARRFPPNQSGWPMCFALVSSFSRETVFTKFGSEETATARARHTSRRRRIPMPTSPRHRARCNHHEAPAGTVAFVSCCIVLLNNGGLGPLDEIALSLPTCMQLSICRRAALAGRHDPLAFSGDKRGRSCAQRSICYRSRTCQIFMRRSELGQPAKYLRDNRKRYHIRSHQLPCSRCNCTVARLASLTRGARQ